MIDNDVKAMNKKSNIEPDSFLEADIQFLILEAETMANETIDKAVKHDANLNKAMDHHNIRNTNSSFDISMDEEFMDAFNQGNGTEEEPYHVRNYEQLELLAVKVNAGYSFTNVYFSLMNDISLKRTDVNHNLVPWVPIGSIEQAFQGIFNGNYHTISDLYIDNEESFQGFFGLIKGSMIKNLTLFSDSFHSGEHSGTLAGMALSSEVVNCLVVSEMRSEDEYIGGVIGFSNNCSITKCTFKGSLISENNHAGGITGYLMNSNLTFCSNTAVIQGRDAVGGLAGTAYMTNKPELKYCKNKGYIKGNSKIGGIIGEVTNDRSDYVNFIIKDSYNQGDIEAGSVAGGITGQVVGNVTILYCYNIGSVKAIDAGVVGGIVGRLNLYLTAMASVYMCYNTGMISAKGTLIGGIVGYNNSIVTKCFLLGNGVLGIGGGPNLNGCKILTASGLRNLGGEIKEPYIEDANLINSGYPILNSINYAEGDRGGSRFSYSSGSERDYSSTYFYTDNYFAKSSYEYDASLASMSICFAMSAFASNWGETYENKSRNARQLLDDTGFSNIKTNRYFIEKPGTDSIGAIAGHKKLTTSSGRDYTLIALAVRGAGYQKEWAGNFKLGETGEHEGFHEAKDHVLDFLNEYVNDPLFKISGSVKLWITSYSRGAATANLTAGALDNGAVLNHCSLNPSDLYAYCFETPAGAIKGEIANNDIYKNIFNIINPNDPVPRVAPEYFGFGRYGIDRVISTRENNEYYLPAKHKMLKRYHILESTIEYTVDDFQMKKLEGDYVILPSGTIIQYPKIVNDISNKISQSRFLDDFLTIISKEVFKSREHYAANIQGSLRNASNIIFGREEGDWPHFTETLKNKLNNNIVWIVASTTSAFSWVVTTEKLLYQYITESLNEAEITDCEEHEIRQLVKVLVTTIFAVASKHPDIVVTAASNIGGIGSAHYPELCLAWVQSMDKNYSDDAKISFSSGSYRVARANCPVDVEVYDDSDILVAAIRSDKPQVIENSSIISSVNADGEKLVYLPAEATYTIKLIATGDGLMSYSINEFSFEIRDIGRIINYYDRKLQAGDVFYGKLPAYNDIDFENGTSNGSTSLYSLSHNESETIIPDTDIKGHEASNAFYMVSATAEEENRLFISGEGIRPLGNYAILTAKAVEGYSFAGWYINDHIVSREAEYRFRVESDVTIIAKAVETALRTEGTFQEFFPQVNFAQAVAEHFGKNAEDRITLEELQRLKTLKAGHKKLSNLDGISQLSGLEEIDLSNDSRQNESSNILTELPNEICLLHNLKNLRVAYNRLEKLPDNIGSLSNLEHFILWSQTHRSLINNTLIAKSKLTKLPDSFWSLKNLNYLGIDHNPIGNLPEDIKNLTNLRALRITNTNADKIPDALSGLSKLNLLSMENNEIKAFPKGCEHLKALYVLQMGGNRFSKLTIGFMDILVRNTGLKHNFSMGGQKALLDHKIFKFGSKLTPEDVLPPIISQLYSFSLNYPIKKVQGNFMIKELETKKTIETIPLIDLLEGSYPVSDLKLPIGQFGIEIAGGDGFLNSCKYDYTIDIIK